MTDPVESMFAGIAGQQIPGGCDACDAYQVVTMLAPGVASLVVHHTDDCIELRSRAARSN